MARGFLGEPVVDGDATHGTRARQNSYTQKGTIVTQPHPEQSPDQQNTADPLAVPPYAPAAVPPVQTPLQSHQGPPPAPYSPAHSQQYQGQPTGAYQHPQTQNQTQQGYAPPQQHQQYTGQPPMPNPAYGYPQPKSKIAAGLLGIFLGGFGVHRFYLGYTKVGLIQLVLWLVTAWFTFGLIALWGFIEGIMILAGAAQFQRDARGIPLRD